MIIYEEVLREFQRQKVKYVLVGGIALNLHGAFRNTADLDILVEMSDPNLARGVGILKKQGYRVRQPVDPMGIANPKLRREWIREKHTKAFKFYKDTEFKEVDIIIESPVSFGAARKDSVSVKVGELSLPVISIDHLIKMKRKAQRAVDLLDIRELEILKELERKR